MLLARALLPTVLPLKCHLPCHRNPFPSASFRRPSFSSWATGCAHITCPHPQPRSSPLPSGKPPSHQAILSSSPCMLATLTPLSSLSSTQATLLSLLWWPLCPLRPHCPHLSPPIAGICGLLLLLALRKFAPALAPTPLSLSSESVEPGGVSLAPFRWPPHGPMTALHREPSLSLTQQPASLGRGEGGSWHSSGAFPPNLL